MLRVTFAKRSDGTQSAGALTEASLRGHATLVADTLDKHNALREKRSHGLKRGPCRPGGYAGRTALIAAATRYGPGPSLELAKLLICRIANVNAIDRKSRSPFLAACGPQSRRPVFRFASFKENLGLETLQLLSLKLLLEKSADKNVKDFKGRSAVELARRRREEQRRRREEHKRRDERCGQSDLNTYTPLAMSDRLVAWLEGIGVEHSKDDSKDDL